MNNADDVLKYSDTKYTHVVFRGNEEMFGIPCDAELWTLEVSEEDAKHRVRIETEGYQSPDYQFFYKEIIRTPMELHSGKKYVNIRVI